MISRPPKAAGKFWGFLGPVRTEPPLGVGGSDPGFIRIRLITGFLIRISPMPHSHHKDNVLDESSSSTCEPFRMAKHYLDHTRLVHRFIAELASNAGFKYVNL